MLNKHLVSIDDVDLNELEAFFKEALTLKHIYFNRHGSHEAAWKEYAKSLTGKIIALVFYEPSTRTRFSFESAVLRLGGDKIVTENAEEFSSAAKNESLEDMIRVVGSYVDTIVLRHKEVGAAKKAAGVSDIPIINAGDGTGEHPTQALLDMFTIWEKFPGCDDLMLTVVGDLKNGRTVHSLLKLVARLKGTSLGLVSRVQAIAPKKLQLPDYLTEELSEAGVSVGQDELFHDSYCALSDVIYMTRTQKERGSDIGDSRRYAITEHRAKLISPEAIIMHPLPRDDGKELPPEVVDDLPQLHCFKQAENGLYVRMALLQMLLNK